MALPEWFQNFFPPARTLTEEDKERIAEAHESTPEDTVAFAKALNEMVKELKARDPIMFPY